MTAASAGVFRNRLDDVRLAMMILTRIPMGRGALLPGATLARALWAYPLAGAIVGGVSGGAFALAVLAGLQTGPAAAVALVVSTLASGSIHEDGLADFSDGIGGGRDRDRKLEIMRDSRIGTYGAVALILSFLVRWSAIAALAIPEKVFLMWIAVDALSRAGIAIPLCLLPPARPDGLGAQAASPPVWSVVVAVVLAIAIAAALIYWHALSLIAVSLVAALVVTILARHHLKGHTGDVLGACALVAESAGLAVASAGWF
jgi:adenosylcobinamide-GDP ribazoletransferase